MRPRAAAAFFVLVAAGAGCSTVLGLTPGSLYDPEGGVSDATVDGVSSDCPAGQKACAGGCVSADDPKYGCQAGSCSTCVGANATAFACQAGACVVTACGSGVGDCDKNPSNGCETDVTNGAHCGSCSQICSGPTPICSGTTCIDASSCDGSICKQTACVDTKNAVHYCGSCDKDCTNPQPSNTTASCVGGACAYSCTAGALDCDKDLGTPSGGNGCECTTACSGNVCCPATGCVNPPDSGPDSGPPDTGPPGDAGPCTAGGGCLPPYTACTVGSAQCCCPAICVAGAILPFSIPDFVDTSIGGACCIPAGTTFPGGCSPNPCCFTGPCTEGGSASKCM